MADSAIKSRLGMADPLPPREEMWLEVVMAVMLLLARWGDESHFGITAPTMAIASIFPPAPPLLLLSCVPSSKPSAISDSHPDPSAIE